MNEDAIIQQAITKLSSRGNLDLNDNIAVESPLEIRVNKFGERPVHALSVTMRTPGNDRELALGFLFTEGIIKSRDQITSINEEQENTIRLTLSQSVVFDPEKLQRHFYMSSSCGVCGKSSIEAIEVHIPNKMKPLNNQISADYLYKLPEKVRQFQDTFNKTGGLHAAALFDSKGELIILREDVGRHNAMDKLVGYCLEANLLPLGEHVIFLSGRASFELIQKSLLAGASVVAAVGAPSSLAIALASRYNQTLIGFLKSDSLNLYSGRQNIQT